MKQVLFIILGFFILWNTHQVKSVALKFNKSINQEENLYFSDPAFISNLSFGYQKIFSHYFWFRTLNYFGKHYKSDKQYESLESLCNITTTLNGQATDSFEFCALMFAWELKQPEKAIQILDSAIRANPTYWRFYYLRGSLKAFFLSNLKEAKEDFISGTNCKGAPNFLQELADKMDNGVTPNALKFLEVSIQEAKTKEEKEILLKRYNEFKNIMEKN